MDKTFIHIPNDDKQDNPTVEKNYWLKNLHSSNVKKNIQNLIRKTCKCCQPKIILGASII